MDRFMIRSHRSSGLARPQTLLQIRQHGGQFAARSFAQACGGTRRIAEKLLKDLNLPDRFAFFQTFFQTFRHAFRDAFLPRAVQSLLIVALCLQSLVVHHPILRFGCDWGQRVRAPRERGVGDPQ